MKQIKNKLYAMKPLFYTSSELIKGNSSFSAPGVIVRVVIYLC